MINESKEDNTK